MANTPSSRISTNPYLNSLRGVREFNPEYAPIRGMEENGFNGTSKRLSDVIVKGMRPITYGTTQKDQSFRNINPATALSGGQPLSMNNTKGPGRNVNWKGIMSKISSTGQALAPFASNIANAFRKPPMPITPQLNNYQTLSKVNMDNERNRVSREVEGSSAQTDRTLDANTAARVRMSNLGTKLNAYSGIAEQERNANVGIANQQAQMDMQTDYINKERGNEYNNSLVERNIAQQSEQSANLSNAADKYIAIGNEKQKAKVDLQKTQTLGLAFSNSGVDNALRQKAKAQGLPDPYGRNYEGMDDPRKDVIGGMKKYGGSLKMRKLS